VLRGVEVADAAEPVLIPPVTTREAGIDRVVKVVPRFFTVNAFGLVVFETVAQPVQLRSLVTIFASVRQIVSSF